MKADVFSSKWVGPKRLTIIFNGRLEPRIHAWRYFHKSKMDLRKRDDDTYEVIEDDKE